MSREIKFRFWSGTKMFYDLQNVMECLKQQMAVWQGAAPLRSYGTVAYDHEKENGAKFLGWTGMKDKNGKEIYDGDMPGGTWSEMVIFWCEQCHGWALKMIDVDHCHSCDGDFMWLDFVGEVRDGKVEIIGNIHENPELLP